MTPEPSAEAGDDPVVDAWEPSAEADAHVRADHDATHEAEMCGDDCIRLGLATFENEPSAEADAALRFLEDRYGHTVEDDGEDNWARFAAVRAALSRPATPPLESAGADPALPALIALDGLIAALVNYVGPGHPQVRPLAESIAHVARSSRPATPPLDEKVRWAVLWLRDLIRDGRISDLDPDDEYVRWAREAAALANPTPEPDLDPPA